MPFKLNADRRHHIPKQAFTGDGAYENDGVTASMAERYPAATIIVPPRANAVPSDTAETAPTQRNRHLRHTPSTAAWPDKQRQATIKRARAEMGM